MFCHNHFPLITSSSVLTSNNFTIDTDYLCATTHCTATISSAHLHTPPSFGPGTLMVLYHTQTQPCSCDPQSKCPSFFAIVVQPYTFRKLSLFPALKILPQTLQKINTFLSYSLLSRPPLGEGLKSVILKFLLPNKSLSTK